MDAELLRRFQPEEYYAQFLERNLRPDGRQLQDRREAALQVGPYDSAIGSASLRFGCCSVAAGVRGLVTEALPDQKPPNRISVTVELPHLCHHSFRERGRANSMSNYLARAFTDILNNHTVFDPSQLDIKGSEVFWTLHVDVMCLNYDGNLFDVCLLAAVAALQDTRLPPLVAKEKGPGKLLAVDGDAVNPVAAGRRVTLKSRPAPITFAELPGSHWALDPTAGEEELGASVSLCLVGHRWLVYHQGGGASADRFLKDLMPAAQASLPSLRKLLEGAGAMECD